MNTEIRRARPVCRIAGAGRGRKAVIETAVVYERLLMKELLLVDGSREYEERMEFVETNRYRHLAALL